MAKTHIYLNFQGKTEEAFDFYKSVFKTEWTAPIMRFGDIPPRDGMPQLSAEDKNKVTHVSLPILGGTLLMGTDMLESLGQNVSMGNNITIYLEPDSKEEADSLYNALSQGATECVAPHDEFWGYWGGCLDRFGIRWMFNIVNRQ